MRFEMSFVKFGGNNFPEEYLWGLKESVSFTHGLLNLVV